jgi:transcriptional regulator with XRE-family HTH domain
MQKNPNPNAGVSLGDYLASIRLDRGMTLREVEQSTDNEVSNAYLSQIERAQVPKPSARILRALADVYKIDSVNLLELAGYVDKPRHEDNLRRGKRGAFAEHNLTSDEEIAMLDFLNWYRHQNKSKK